MIPGLCLTIMAEKRSVMKMMPALLLVSCTMLGVEWGANPGSCCTIVSALGGLSLKYLLLHQVDGNVPDHDLLAICVPDEEVSS